MFNIHERWKMPVFTLIAGVNGVGKSSLAGLTELEKQYTIFQKENNF